MSAVNPENLAGKPVVCPNNSRMTNYHIELNQAQLAVMHQDLVQQQSLFVYSGKFVQRRMFDLLQSFSSMHPQQARNERSIPTTSWLSLYLYSKLT